jgi:hypothetical protein
MATITDPQIIKWANERARSAADHYAQFIAELRDLLGTYGAQGIGTRLAAWEMGDILGDGSATDGRPTLTRNQILLLIADAIAIRDAADADPDVDGIGALLKRFLAIAPNP